MTKSNRAEEGVPPYSVSASVTLGFRRTRRDAGLLWIPPEAISRACGGIAGPELGGLQYSESRGFSAVTSSQGSRNR